MRILLLMTVAFVSGCGLTNQVKLNESRDAYQRCLIEKKAIAPCEPLRLAFEADRDVVAASGSGLMGTGARDVSNDTSDQPRSWMQNQGGRSYICNNYGGMVTCN